MSGAALMMFVAGEVDDDEFMEDDEALLALNAPFRPKQPPPAPTTSVLHPGMVGVVLWAG